MHNAAVSGTPRPAQAKLVDASNGQAVAFAGARERRPDNGREPGSARANVPDAAVAHTEGSDPRPAPPGASVRPATPASGSHPVIQASNQVAPRPPVLASEALLRDLSPPEPAPRLLRLWAPLLGVLGACAAWFLTQGRGLGVPLAGAFAALALLGLPRMPYTTRAGAVATVASTGLAMVLWADMGSRHGPETLVLTLTIVLLASGLFFRSWHRASPLARAIVTLGVCLGAGYLWMSEAFTSFTMHDTAWQSWLPRLVMLPFGLLLMLSLLVFMNARTTAGASAWAGLLLLWYALHAAVEVLYAAWPKQMAEPNFNRLELETMLAWGSAPVFSALLAVGIAQLIAAAVARGSGAHEPL